MTETTVEEQDELLPLGLAPEDPETKTARQMELLSPSKILTIQFIHLISQLFILGIFFFGPSYISSHLQHFGSPTITQSKRFTFDYKNLHVFHAFLALDLVLFRDKRISFSPFNISVSFFASQNTHSGELDPIVFPVRKLEVTFRENSEESHHLRLFETSLIDFTDIHAWVAVKYPDIDLLDNLTGGNFEWFYADPAHSIIQLFLRFIFFGLALFVLTRLLVADFNLYTSHIAMRLMFWLDIVLVIGSNPFYILTFFSRSHALRLFDSLIGLFLLVAALFTAFALLIMTGLTHRDVTFSWIIIRFIPFGIVYCIFAAGLMSYHALVDADPLGETEKVSSLFALAKGIALAVYLVAYVVAGLTVFQPEFKYERRAVVPLGLTLFVAICAIDVLSAKSKYAELKFANQIYSLLAVGTYILIFNFLNWPVNRQGEFKEDREDNKEGIARILDLDEDV